MTVNLHNIAKLRIEESLDWKVAVANSLRDKRSYSVTIIGERNFLYNQEEPIHVDVLGQYFCYFYYHHVP